ncbi:MAG: TlpA disulfide reductase family protein [Bacteroidota bacterium]
MKNIAYISIFFISTSFTIFLEPVALTGKILNTDGKIKIKGELFEKEIILQEDGSFSENIMISYSGLYVISTEKNKISVYLSPGTELSITADDKFFNESVLFSGKGSIENQYLIEKSKICSENTNESLYSLDEASFLSKIKEIKQTLFNLYSKTEFQDQYFKDKEALNINYLEQLYILNYPDYHAFYTKNKDYKVFVDFPKFDRKINLDNDEDFLFSYTYRQIVSANFNEILLFIDPDEAIPIEKKALPVIRTIQSQYIRNALVQNLSQEVKTSNPEAENLFNELVSISTDSIFKRNLSQKFSKINNLVAGKPSPKFDYVNHNGGKTALDSLKGKYVFIDLWTTWCTSCRKELPSLQKLKDEFKQNNISFVSISLDKEKDYEKWNNLVKDKQLKGFQLFADKGWNSQFAKDFVVETIPRFILLDPEGNIIDADAPRPSDEKINELLRVCKK